MEFIDYYKILEINNTATEADIKKAYRKLARKLHPDLNPNDKEAQRKFQIINEANEVLSDTEKRKNYDLYGKDWKHAEQFEQQKNQEQQYSKNYTQFTDNDNTSFSSFFESMFGNSQNIKQTKYSGEDYHAEFTLSLYDAAKTHQQTIDVNNKKIRITLPAGIENGQTIKLKGYGAAGANGGPSGDLFIRFIITNNTHFKRLGNDLYTKATIDLYTALLGGETTINTLDGKVKLKVNPETQYGTKIRLKGKGMPIYKKEAEFGDLYVTYEIILPTNLTEAEKVLFTQLSTL